MLSKIESRILSGIYSLCCHHFAVPLTWADGKMHLKLKTTQNALVKLWNFVTYALLGTIISFQIKQLVVMIKNEDINGSIVNITLLMAHFGNLIFKFNIWLYQSELAHIINQVLQINKYWGK